MSARTPFVPQRPASRLNSNQSDHSAAASSPQLSHESLCSNGLLPSSNTDEKVDAQLDSHQTNATDAESAPLQKLVNRPLNISAFVKNKPLQSTHIPGKSRKSFEDATARSRSPKPPLSNLNHQALRVAAPRPSSPFFPSSSGFISMHGFRAPPHPLPSKLQSTTSVDELSSNEAHIPTSAHSLASDKPDGHHHTSQTVTQSSDRRIFSAAYDSVPPMKSRTHIASHPSLEKISEVVEEEDLNQPHDGAQCERVPNDYNEFNAQDHARMLRQDNEDENCPSRALRRTGKRVERIDEDEQYDYGNEAKRYKPDGLAHDFPPPYSRQSTPASQYSMAAGQSGGGPLPAAHHYQLDSPYAQPSALPMRDADQEHGQHALHRIFGHELNVYVDSHIEVYEEAKKKWSECSMDDWKAGADELTNKFGKMLEFVKDHMTSKIALYTSLHSAVSAHRTVLTDREQTLQEARESLVRDGGNVVGGGQSDGKL